MSMDWSGNPVFEGMPDFSYCGYKGGNTVIPRVAVKVQVPPCDMDATSLIQSAIDQVGRLPLDDSGFRGAVLLSKGEYRIEGQLVMKHDGIVLRGSGQQEDGTLLRAAGTSRRALIAVEGQEAEKADQPVGEISDALVPAGATAFRLSDTGSLRCGDRIWIERPSTKRWIREIGMDQIATGFKRIPFRNWGNEQYDAGSLWWERTVVSIDGTTVTVDAPITTAIEHSYGGGKVYAASSSVRLRNVGIEHIQCVSDYDRSNSKDENHAWTAVQMRMAEDAWVRHVTMRHFAGNSLALLHGTRKVTVADCEVWSPIGEEATGRRRAFFTMGQQTLFLRCRSEGARHDFAVGRGLLGGELPTAALEAGTIRIPLDPAAAGPNAFVRCVSRGTTAYCGPLQNWASGVLYDQVVVEGASIRMTDQGAAALSSGWACANSVLWRCTAAAVVCDAPPTANQWAVLCQGDVKGTGVIIAEDAAGDLPESLYEAQRKQRLGANYTPLQMPAAPDVDDLEPVSGTLDVDTQAIAGDSRLLADRPDRPGADEPEFAIQGGWFQYGQRPLWGFGKFSGYWQILLQRASLTRNGLEEVAQGRTEDMPKLTENMVRYAYPFWYHSYGLWYDRRRDQHDLLPREDGDAAPPFYEQPWARSGTGTAWDGLSKYDLTRFNSFYFEQLERFVQEAHRRGAVLLHNYYLQHCITGGSASHYVDFPWRPANCIQPVQMPDGIQAANAFYDVSIPLHAELHRLYIRRCLDAFGKYDNVVHLVSAEYTGPASFVRFWMETIREWEQETGHKVRIGLGATKDVMEEILSDNRAEERIDVLELTYWNYTPDGEINAPLGGQEVHVGWPKGTTPQMVYRQIREARLEYPDKGIIKLLTLSDEYGGMACTDPAHWLQFALACLMGGGAVPVVHNHIVVNEGRDYGVPKTTPAIQKLYDWLPQLPGSFINGAVPCDVETGQADSAWGLYHPGQGCLVCLLNGGQVRIPISEWVNPDGSWQAHWLHAATGKTVKAEGKSSPGYEGKTVFEAPDGDIWLLWVQTLSYDGGITLFLSNKLR